MSFLKRKTLVLRRTRHLPELKKKVSAYSYHNSRNEQEEAVGRDTKHLNRGGSRLSFWLNRFGFIVLLIVGAVCLFSVLDLSSSPNVVFLGNNSSSQLYKQNQAAFLATSTKLFNSSILNHNKITVDTNSITKTLMADFPEFSSVSITLPLINHRPIIYLTPGTPSIVLNNAQGQYLLNQNGVAMLSGTPTNNFANLSLPTVNDQSGLRIKLGQPALTSQDVSFIQTITSQLAAKQDKVLVMTLPQATNQLNVNLVGKSYYVKFNLQNDDPRVQAGNFLATEHYLITQKITPSQYIDVRTDGRSYYL